MTIKDAIKELFKDHDYLRIPFSKGLLNLDYTATYMSEMIKTKISKEVKRDSIANALRELQIKREEIESIRRMEESFFIDKTTIHRLLVSFTYDFNQDLALQVIKATSGIQENYGNICIIHGMKELSLIFDAKDEKFISDNIRFKVKKEKRNLAAIVINYDKKYYETPGIIYKAIQSISLQNIPIFEILNTYTELIIHVDEEKADIVGKTLSKYFRK